MTQKTESHVRIVQHLLQIGAYLQKNGNRLTQALGLTQQQFVVLNEIVSWGPVNQKQLVGELLLEKSNVSKIVKKLHTAELIEISVCTDDARSTVLTPTRKGRKIWAAGMRRLNQWNVKWLEMLTEKEMATTAAVLERLKRLVVEDSSAPIKSETSRTGRI